MSKARQLRSEYRGHGALLFVCLFGLVLDEVFCSPVWPRTHYVAKDNLCTPNLFSPSSWYWDPRCAPPHPVFLVLEVKLRASGYEKTLSTEPHSQPPQLKTRRTAHALKKTYFYFMCIMFCLHECLCASCVSVAPLGKGAFVRFHVVAGN